MILYLAIYFAPHYIWFSEVIIIPLFLRRRFQRIFKFAAPYLQNYIKKLLQLATNFTYWRHISNRLELFCKKGVLRNFAKFTGKHLIQRLFFNKVAGLKAFVKIRFQHKGLHLYEKKSLWHSCFPLNFTNFLRTSFNRTLPVAVSVPPIVKISG